MTTEADTTTFPPYAPDHAEVETLRREQGLTWETAHDLLVSQAQSQAAQMTAVAPGLASEVATARREADEARDRADEATAKHQTLISGLEHDILGLAQLRSRIEQFKMLVNTANDLPGLAAAALDTFDSCLQESSPALVAGYQLQVSQLANLAALKPFLPARLRSLEAEAGTKLATIRQTAAAEKINLPALVANMRAGATPQVKQLDAGGFLDLADSE